MKKTSLIIFVIGLIMTVLSGVSLITREKILDFGRVQITAQKRHAFDWSPLFGVSVMALGACAYIFARKNTSIIRITK
jgi:hypothetical protein